MELRLFGTTDLSVSVIGFGAWGIGGPAMAGSTPIGWGKVNDDESRRALLKACDLGIRFFDTANFYGLGHSEKLIGETLGNRSDIVVATKVGHRLNPDGTIALDYSKKHILQACDESLRRLRRETIDFYQLHSARLPHLEQGECIEAMEKLQQEGKIRYWGLSLNTFAPAPEAEFLMERRLGHGFQLVFNVINQRALPVLRKASQKGYGIIARMPLQFGLLTGKFERTARFAADDHRAFRLPREVLAESLDALEEVWPVGTKYGISKTSLSLSYPASFQEVSAIIPGIKTVKQAELNTSGIVQLGREDRDYLEGLFEKRMKRVMEVMEHAG